MKPQRTPPAAVEAPLERDPLSIFSQTACKVALFLIVAGCAHHSIALPLPRGSVSDLPIVPEEELAKTSGWLVASAQASNTIDRATRVVPMDELPLVVSMCKKSFIY